MFGLVLVALPHALAPHWSAGSRPGRHLDLSSNTNTLWLLHHKLSVDFIDLAMNQLVNYLISKALWVSAEPPSSPQCIQVSLNHWAHVLAPDGRKHTGHARQPHTPAEEKAT